MIHVELMDQQKNDTRRPDERQDKNRAETQS